MFYVHANAETHARTHAHTNVYPVESQGPHERLGWLG